MPENYRLFEHVKFTASENGEPVKCAGNQADDPNHRQDSYLYGHPQGPRKRFRSPADFFPHLLWLATDDSGDPDNCSCKICAPEDIQVFDKPTTKAITDVSRKEDFPPVQKDIVQRVNTEPLLVLPKRPVIQENVPKPVPKPAPVHVMAQIPPRPQVWPPVTLPLTPPVLQPTLLGRASRFEQDQDAQYSRYLFRPGELVWFNRGTAWGLAVIVRRDLFKDVRHQDRPKYVCQPLSHPFQHPEIKIITQEDLLRPWLAWSAPAPTHAALATQGNSYNNIDWRGVLEGRFGGGDAEVDGSIFAAKAIDESFTLIEPLSNNTLTTGERTYAGIYFGGEKIWVGEPVRLRIGTGQDIMIVHHIIEKLKPGSTNASSATISVVGDIYRFATMNHTPGQEPPDSRHLPLRLTQDLDYRNRHTIPHKRTFSYWKITQAQTRLSIAEVKGRWYESSVLLPILRGAADFTRDLRKGDISDVGQWMNGRGDSSLAAGKQGIRYFDRLDAFGKAVPPGTRISKGLDGPPEDNVFPVEQQQQQQQQQHQHHGNGGGVAGGGQDSSRQQQQQQVQVQVQHQVQQQQQQQQHQQQQQVVGDGNSVISEFMNLERMDQETYQPYPDAGNQFFHADGMH